MAWHLQCAYKTSPKASIGYISSGWTDNQHVTVTSDKNGALAIQHPLYRWHSESYLRAPGSSQDWYGSEWDGYARWVFWNSAKAITWDIEGNSSTISLAGAPKLKLSKPDTDKPWLKWSDQAATIILLTWEEW